MIRAFKRWQYRRNIHFWGERMELLERRHASFAADIRLAMDQCARWKRELAALDIARAVSVTHAPGPAPRDGRIRFSLVQDRPRK